MNAWLFSFDNVKINTISIGKERIAKCFAELIEKHCQAHERPAVLR